MRELRKRASFLERYTVPDTGISAGVLAHMHILANTTFQSDGDRNNTLLALMDFNDKMVEDAKTISRLKADKVVAESPEGMRAMWDTVRKVVRVDEDVRVVHEKKYSHWTTFDAVVEKFVETFPAEWDGVIGMFGEHDLGFFERYVRLGTNEVVTMSVRFTEDYWDCKVYK